MKNQVSDQRCSRRTALIGAALVSLSVWGCGPGKPVASAADLQRLGTKSYPSKQPEEVSAAAVAALRILGYEVVTTSPRIRTAPKNVATTAVGSGNTAQAYTEAVAWDIEVKAEGSGSVLHATQRTTVNGQPMEQIYLDWAERSFGELMREIDTNLPAAGSVQPRPQPEASQRRASSSLF